MGVVVAFWSLLFGWRQERKFLRAQSRKQIMCSYNTDFTDVHDRKKPRAQCDKRRPTECRRSSDVTPDLSLKESGGTVLTWVGMGFHGERVRWGQVVSFNCCLGKGVSARRKPWKQRGWRRYERAVAITYNYIIRSLGLIFLGDDTVLLTLEQ